MRNQFFYTVEQQVGTAEAPETKTSIASLNIDMVIRSIEIHTGELIIILDDFHEEMVNLPDSIDIKTNKIIKGKRELSTVQSEITLSVADKERFYNFLNIEL